MSPHISDPKRLAQSRVQVTVTVSAEEAVKAEAQALTSISKDVNVPGFRPGKAPPEMVRGKVKEEALLEETVRAFLPEVLQSVMTQHSLKPVLPPKVEITSRSPLTLTLTFVERPEVKVKNLDVSKLKKGEPKFDEKDVERMVQYLLEQYRTTQVVDRPAQEGDQVTMDFVGFGADGQELAGTRSTNYPVVIGSKTLIPGFEEGLKGAKRGEKRDLQLTFPEKYHAEHLAGKPVKFTVDVRDIHQVTTPTLTPEFVKEKGLGESPDDVRSRIAGSMREEEERMERERREQALFEAIRSSTQIDIAPELLEAEERTLLEDLARQLEEQKTNFEDWLKRTKRTAESLRKELQEEARRRITLRFGVQTLLDDKQIQATPEEIKELTAQRLASVPAEQRAEAGKYFAEGSDGYEEVKWQKRVEKLVKGMLE